MTAILEEPMSASQPTTAKRLKVTKTVAVVNPKGGVGKSTISTLLAMELTERGYTVRFADCDKQASSSTWLDGSDYDIPVSRMLSIKEIHHAMPPMALAEDGCIVIADGPAGENEINRMLMCQADVAILPCGPSAVEVAPLWETKELLDMARPFHIKKKGLPLSLIIPNRIDPRGILSKELLSSLKQFGMGILPPLVKRQIYADAAGQHTSVKRLPGKASDQAGAELDALTDALLEELVK